MSSPVLCGAESTVVHVAASRPIVGALICVGLGVGGVQYMTGAPDQFGGCGVTGGELHQVIDIPQASTPQVCAVPEDPPIAVKK